MNPKDLHSVWSMPDNSRLTAKQYSFRLPVHVAAKLAALCELYPNKTRTQLVGDLLATAIEAAVKGLPSIKGAHLDRIAPPDEREFDLFEDVGPAGRFKHLANRYYQELERELGNEQPGLAYPYEYTGTRDGEEVTAFTVGEQVAP
jgi:hypothetical protein